MMRRLTFEKVGNLTVLKIRLFLMSADQGIWDKGEETVGA